MALKRKITKADYDKLAADLKTEYVADGDDNYRLDLDGEEDNGALKRAKDRETQLRKDAEKKAAELAAQLDSLTDSDAKKRGDIEALEKSWKEKSDKERLESETKTKALRAHIEKQLVDNVALQIATKISTAPSIILPHVRARLQADFEGDEPKTRVLGADGKPSALTTDELANEFVANKDFSAIMIASKASGGAGGAKRPGSGAPHDGDDKKDLKALTTADIRARIEAKHPHLTQQ